jgi:type I restriction enzyme, S subunit
MSELPKSWCSTEIEHILEPLETGKVIQQGWSPQCEKMPSQDGEWGVLKTTAIQEGVFLSNENKKLPEHMESRPAIEVKSGDILMTCAGPRNRCGVTCFVKETRGRLMMSGKMYRFRTDREKVTSKYLEEFLLSQEAKFAIDKMKTGINDSGLNLTHGRFKSLTVPIAPLNEQKRIVLKIEGLFSELDKGVVNLKTAREQLKTYRQAVLKHAFAGNLTTQLRDENSDQINNSISSQIVEIPKSEIEELANIPSVWKWVALESLTEKNRPITYGVIKLGKDDPSGVPTLRSSDVRRLHLDLKSVKKISPDISNNYKRTILHGDEIVITIRGTLGGVSVVPKECIGYNISREVALICPIEDQIRSKYLQFFVASFHVEKWFKSQLRGVAYTGINLASLRKTPIALCSILEQDFIVEGIEQRLSRVDDLEQLIDIELRKSESLRQSILKKAFSGQLVPQDPSDEPASVLLGRIRTEKAVQQTTNATPKKRRKRKVIA